jgi:hypothetical protein
MISQRVVQAISIPWQGSPQKIQDTGFGPASCLFVADHFNLPPFAIFSDRIVKLNGLCVCAVKTMGCVFIHQQLDWHERVSRF